MEPKPHARLFVETALAEGADVELSPEQAHYLRNVMRLGEGDVIALFNGRDGEFRARLGTVARRAATVTVEQRLRAQEAEPDLWLVFAPIKRARIDYLVEKATELGVGALAPVITRHTIVERLNLERLRAHAIEAAEQSERLSVPTIAAPRPLDALLGAWEASRRIVLCDESGTAPPIAEALAGQSATAWAVLVGPEGGFAETELDAIRKLPFVSPVSLGPRILRADTAALAGLAVLQALRGEAARRR
ncbi:MAG TPA: 16S rRNA (uracil(1498)-N(3))-methyltransferase [Stellaceae bacterium]|jgi:16S rRNA (uracil1498-N3)-methyltransferase|nr:16S rRNA (uracil(1498)-N(3))-methyltransferase [Stellaceae bacterium]